MSVNISAVREIYHHDGYDAAVKYCVEHENMTLSASRGYVSSFDSPSSLLIFNNPPLKEEYTVSYYCERDRHLFVSSSDQCPICKGHIMKDECLVTDTPIYSYQTFWQKLTSRLKWIKKQHNEL